MSLGSSSVSGNKSEEVQQMQFVRTNKERKLRQQIIRVVVIASVPLALLLIAVSISQLVQTQKMSAMDTQITSSVEETEKIHKLVMKLQVERGLTCVFLTARKAGESAKQFQNVLNARAKTTAVLEDLTWSPTSDAPDPDLRSKDNFRQALNEFRNYLIEHNKTECAENLVWYTAKIDGFILRMVVQLKATSDGKLWSSILGYQAMIMASDLIGLKRARGGAVFVNKIFDSAQNGIDFIELSGTAQRLFDFGILLGSRHVKNYKTDSLTKNAVLLDQINLMESKIRTGVQVKRFDMGQLEITSDYWFNNHTAYMRLVADIETETSKEIVATLAERLRTATLLFYGMLLSTLFIGSICAIMTALSCKQLSRVLVDIHDITAALENNAEQELEAERKRMENLVHELLPKTIADDLKNHKAVKPRNFQEVTIFHSEIFEFAELTKKTTAIMIVNMLNNLYTTCDTILDRYNVYKVQAVGDSYIVVSGCPKKNGHSHSNEIATVALDILRVVEDFTIDVEGRTEPLLMKIGVHTGSVATGIVGTKMPRYCLFGDTVSIAQEMKNWAKPMQINISSATKDHLDQYFPGEFRTTPRAMIDVMGTSSNEGTYWLLGKMGFPFSVDNTKAHSKVKQASYWRSATKSPSVKEDVSSGLFEPLLR